MPVKRPYPGRNQFWNFWPILGGYFLTAELGGWGGGQGAAATYRFLNKYPGLYYKTNKVAPYSKRIFNPMN